MMSHLRRLLGRTGPVRGASNAAASAGNADGRWQLPSPWLGSFESEAGFSAAMAAIPRILDVVGHIDDQLVASRHPRRFPAFCENCGSVQTMRLDWSLVGTTADGSVHPAWTETCTCEGCGLNSRMRAMVGFVMTHDSFAPGSRCYLAERVTPSHAAFASHFRDLTASEYLGSDRRPGESVFMARHAATVRHEDLTGLSFGDGSFDWVVTQDVFEHIPDYPAAFRECARVLVPGGHMAFSIPFDSSLKGTVIRARLSPDGQVEHVLPPEIHGNPVDGQGALCFQNFGWDILDTLRSSGFSNASANAYWGPWMGHLGFGGLVFCARR